MLQDKKALWRLNSKIPHYFFKEASAHSTKTPSSSHGRLDAALESFLHENSNAAKYLKPTDAMIASLQQKKQAKHFLQGSIESLILDPGATSSFRHASSNGNLSEILQGFFDLRSVEQIPIWAHRVDIGVVMRGYSGKTFHCTSCQLHRLLRCGCFRRSTPCKENEELTATRHHTSVDQ